MTKSMKVTHSEVFCPLFSLLHSCKYDRVSDDMRVRHEKGMGQVRVTYLLCVGLLESSYRMFYFSP